MSINPGNCGGSLASPDRKARRKLISGSRLSSIRTRPNPFPNLVPTASGRFSGRGWSGGGITRRKVSACMVVIIGAASGPSIRVDGSFLHSRNRWRGWRFIWTWWNLGQGRSRLIRFAGLLRLGRRRLFGGGNDIQQHAIIGVEVTRHGVANSIGRYIEVILQISIE